jgi:hypothetical protein
MRCGPPGSLNPTAIAVAYEGAGSRPTPAPGEKKRILAAIDAKIAGKEVVASPHAGEEAGAQVIDLTQALMASLKGTCCDCEGADCSQASAGEGWGQRGRDGCQAQGRAPRGQDRGTGCGTGTHPRPEVSWRLIKLAGGSSGVAHASQRSGDSRPLPQRHRSPGRAWLRQAHARATSGIPLFIPGHRPPAHRA